MKPPEASSSGRSNLAYRGFMASSLAGAMTVVGFFVLGLADGSVSSFNIALWLLLLTVVGLVLWSGRALRARGRTGLAIAILAIVAVPGWLCILFLLLVLLTQPHWN